MTELLTLPPTGEAIATLAAIPGSQIAPVMMGTLRGPEAHVGPEAAGAILMLQATFTSEAGNDSFWKAAAPLMKLLSAAPGFIRSYGFGDGPNNTLLAFWRSADEAQAFAARPEHREAVRDLYQQRWQHSHFAALWEMTANHDRVIFCPDCSAVTPVREQRCSGCGAELFDNYRAG